MASESAEAPLKEARMSRISMAQAAMVAAAALALVITAPVTASAAATAAGGPGSLAAAVLDTGDVPAGFQPNASLTGPLDGARAQALGIDPGQLGAHEALVRSWLSPSRTVEVVETGIDSWTGESARADVTATVAGLVNRRAVRQALPGPARLDAYGGYVQGSTGQQFELLLPLARGPYFFVLEIITAPSSAASSGPLLSTLAAAQLGKVPADTPDTADPRNFATTAAGSAVGVLFGYLLIVDGVAYWRNPLRRRRGQRRATALTAGPGIIDVSAQAKKNKRTAIGRLATQFAGLAVAAYGADVFLVHFWYAYLIAGAAIVWAGGRFVRPGGVRPDHTYAMLAGKHKILVTGLLAVAAGAILLGLACAVFAGLYQAFPPDSTVQLGPGQAATATQTVGSQLAVVAFILIALGAVIFRTAHRLASIRARQLMRRDPRPPVLYLRSFGDDRLKLWTATLGRPALIERFTPRRFDTFEQMLVRYLSGYGPVIAVNPPGTRLAPLGAARETIDSADWQAVVASWMAQSRLIVFATPPSQVNRGLRWELEAVSAHGYWDKALIVVPPVRAEQLRARWRDLLDVRLGPFAVPGPVDDPHALVLALRNGRWEVISASRRTEWSYSAAVEQALGDPRQQPAPQRTRPPAPQRPAARRRPLTLATAGLVVFLAAAVAGAGSWYATHQAPVAHQSAITSASSPAPTPPASSDSASPSPSAPAQGVLDTLVSLAPAAAGYPGAAGIQSVIAEYFRAINSRDYTGYLSTQSSGQAMSEQDFRSGFESTTDSHVLVTSITTGSDGRPAAEVTFSSRQQPHDGPEGESCTNWQVTMFFDGDAGTYTIGAPPADYHASYQAC
jgi:hypothetical protein